jgi:hypothetical protein
MKILEQVQAIFARHEWKPVKIPAGYKSLYEYLREDRKERIKPYSSEKDDGYFINKYKTRIPPGWYGFSIGNPIIPEWCDIIDETLEACVAADPDFEINQIKIKFGGIRFYVETQVIEDINEIERLIENTLYDKALIY